MSMSFGVPLLEDTADYDRLTVDKIRIHLVMIGTIISVLTLTDHLTLTLALTFARTRTLTFH